MRKVLALLLLAGAATPALAAADPGDRAGWQSRLGQQSTSDNRGNRSDGNDRPHRGNRDGGGNYSGNNDGNNDRPQPVVHVESNGGGNNDGNHAPPVVHVESNGGGGNAGEHRFHNGVRSRISSGDERPAIQPGGGDATPAEPVHIRRGPKIVEAPQGTTESHETPTLREQHRPLPGVFRNRVPVVSNTPHEGTQPPLRVDNRSRDRNHNWNTSWRNNHRYDWQDWRRRHHSHFHLGFYYDPFGWSYRPYQIGWRLWPSYYSSQFWINNPYDYRLPYAPPGYRWIRYYDDALLIDTWDGEVVDVIHNFFW